MKTVNILVWVDGIENLFFIDMFWQGKLDQDAVYAVILIILLN